MLEPTKEAGFAALRQVQAVPYTVTELQLIYRLYQLRKACAGNAPAQATLDQAFQALVKLPVATAATLLNGLALATTQLVAASYLQLYPNPVVGNTLTLLTDARLRGGTVRVLDMLGRAVLTTSAQPARRQLPPASAKRRDATQPTFRGIKTPDDAPYSFP